jgi:hypothetical protein
MNGDHTGPVLWPHTEAKTASDRRDRCPGRLIVISLTPTPADPDPCPEILDVPPMLPDFRGNRQNLGPQLVGVLDLDNLSRSSVSDEKNPHLASRCPLRSSLLQVI